jgi:tetratricopeptide (TPR) repeat protein
MQKNNSVKIKLPNNLILWSLFLVLIFGLKSNIYSQDHLSRQYEFANKLFEQELFFDAVTEYKRLLYFDNDNRYEYEANFRTGSSYKLGGKYDNAIIYFRKSELIARNAEEIFNSKIEIIRCNILRKTTDTALHLLKEIDNDTRFYDKKDMIFYWQGWAYMLADDWKNAALSFYRMDPGHELRTLAWKVENDKYSVTFAKVISYILPGFGQFYTGHYLSGFMSIGWNALWGYLTINAFIENRAFDGIVIGNLLWLRFYKGNYENAEKFAVDENIKISNKALRFLENNYDGEKP